MRIFIQSEPPQFNQSINKQRKKFIIENELKMDNSLSYNYCEQRRDDEEEKKPKRPNKIAMALDDEQTIHSA